MCPDIVTVGKPIANGHPVSALITRREIAMKFLEAEGPNARERVREGREEEGGERYIERERWRERWHQPVSTAGSSFSVHQ